MTSKWVIIFIFLGHSISSYGIGAALPQATQPKYRHYTPDPNQPSYCSDLYAYACKSNATTEDPTGNIILNNRPVIEKAEKDIEPRFLDQWSVILQMKPDLLSKAKSAFNLSQRPECKSNTSKDVRLCSQIAAKELVPLTLSKIDPNFKYELPQNFSAPEQDAVISSGELNKTKQHMITELIYGPLQIAKNQKIVAEEIFPDVKRRMVKVINGLDIPDVQKQRMLDKMKTIEMRWQGGGMECPEYQRDRRENLKQTYNDRTLSSALVVNADYSNHLRTFEYCNGLAMSSSRASMTLIVGHELAHSIDPCSNSISSDEYARSDLAASDAAYPANNLIKCLRNPKSAGAKHDTESNWTWLSRNIAGEKIEPFCEGDQIIESIADWMGVEVLADYLGQARKSDKGLTWTNHDSVDAVANAMRPLCGFNKSGAPVMDDENHFSVHPPTDVRINRVLAQNPRLRAMMGCQPVPQIGGYCDGNDPNPKNPSGFPEPDKATEGTK